MTDEQCNVLISVLKDIVNSLNCIAENVDNIYGASMEGVENKLEKLTDVIWDK